MPAGTVEAERGEGTPMAITSSVEEVTPDLIKLRYLIVNLYLAGRPEEWVLIDAGMLDCSDTIIETAAERFGAGKAPACIVMTHAHFDHRGAFPKLFETWDVPVYAHRDELPYLTGQADYPPPDPSVGRGVMALTSFMFPNGGIDIGDRAKPLPQDGTVPHMPGWRWVYTPGHTPGHISLFRDNDRCLIAGDAFVCTKQESLYSVATQDKEIHGPPSYFTPDWVSARRSVETLAALKPEIAATGHGPVMRGPELQGGLADLSARFDELAVPDQGRYVPPGKTDGL